MITAARVVEDGIYVRFADEHSGVILAQRAGVNRVSIARIEAGHQLPRYSTLVALAEALEVPLDRLLAG